MKIQRISAVCKKMGFWVAMGILLFGIITPLYVMVTTSVKTDTEITRGILGISKITLQHYREVLVKNPAWGAYMGTNLLLPLWNSLIVALSVTFVSLIVGLLAAYGLTIIQPKGKDILSAYILFAYIFPPFILVIPLSVILNKVGLLDSLVGVGISHLIITVAFVTWIMKGYFMTIPRELHDAALVDGCSKVGALVRVIVPVSIPGVVPAAIFSFARSWSDLLFALVILTSKESFTLPLAATMMTFGEYYKWGNLMATAVISSIPPVILYMIIQRYLVTGLTAGAVKS